jgi:hypothetical protein
MPQSDPIIPVFPAGYGPFPADFATWVTNPFTFLTSKVMFRGQQQASQALTAGAVTAPIQIGATAGDVLEDPYGGWSTTVTGSQPAYSWLCPAGCSGWYEVTVTGLTASPGGITTDQVEAVLSVDGATYAETAATWGIPTGTSGASGVFQVPLLGGNDYIEMGIFSAAATTTPAVAGRYPTMEIAWISL